MSYILDALRKSEQERQRGKVPHLNSYMDEPTVEAPRRNIWPWVTAAVIAINITIVAIIWAPSRGPEPVAQTATATPAPTPTPVPEQQVSAPAQAPAQTAPPPQATTPVPAAQPEQVPSTVVVDQRPPVQDTPTVVSPQTPAYSDEPEEPFYPPPAPNVAYLPQLEELPSHQRGNIPDMTFSSHMYSSVPRFRSIIINGKRLKEGEYFTENLQVREITDKGVIMSNGNVLFAVDVLGRWAQ